MEVAQRRSREVLHNKKVTKGGSKSQKKDGGKSPLDAQIVSGWACTHLKAHGRRKGEKRGGNRSKKKKWDVDRKKFCVRRVSIEKTAHSKKD